MCFKLGYRPLFLIIQSILYRLGWILLRRKLASIFSALYLTLVSRAMQLHKAYITASLDYAITRH